MKLKTMISVFLIASLLAACSPVAQENAEAGTVAPSEATIPANTETTIEEGILETAEGPDDPEAYTETAPESLPESAELTATSPAATTTPSETTSSTKIPLTGTTPAPTDTSKKPVSTPQETTSSAASSTGSSNSTTDKSADNFPAATENSTLMFNRGTQTIFVGESASVDYIYHGNKKLTWFTSHPRCITVDPNGRVTPKYEGNYILYVSDGQYTAKTNIFAPQGWGMDSGMRFDNLNIELVVGQSMLLSPSNVSPGSYITYTSSNTSVVRTSGAYITAVAPGTAVITAKTEWDFTRTTVTVVPASTTVKLDIHKTSINLHMFDEVKLDYTYTGTETLKWESSNWNVARITEDGLIFAGAEGTCTIYLTDGNYADECSITVSIAPGVTVTALDFRSTNGPIYDGVTKYKGDYLQFDVSVTPNNADRDTYVTVSDSSIIKATRTYNMGEPTFRLDFKKAGTCTVYIHSGDNQVTNSYTIHVKDGYDGYPGSGLLTPEQFVSCYNQILEANGMSTDYTPTGYLVLTLSPEKLTREQARKSAEGLGHHWWSIGYRTMQVTFEGINEDGNYVFYERGC